MSAESDNAGSPAGATADREWLLLTYRVPSKSSRARVAVWRDLRRLGALYLQQAVCVLPDVAPVRKALAKIRGKIAELDGTSFSARLSNLDDDDRQQLIDGFISGSQKEYEEIVEECETKFFKEIEFERFRQNYTFEEAEEIRQDLEKLKRWLATVVARDWIGAPGRQAAEDKVAECEELLEEFERDVFELSGQGGDEGSDQA